ANPSTPISQLMVRESGQTSPRRRSRSTQRRYITASTTETEAKSSSGTHSVNQALRLGADGTGRWETSSAALIPSCGSCGLGGRESASATATPITAVITTISTPARRQNAQDLPGAEEASKAGIVRCRCA